MVGGMAGRVDGLQAKLRRFDPLAVGQWGSDRMAQAMRSPGKHTHGRAGALGQDRGAGPAPTAISSAATMSW